MAKETKIDYGWKPGVHDMSGDQLYQHEPFIVLYHDGTERGFQSEKEAEALWARVQLGVDQ